MGLVVIRSKVKDYATWRSFFDTRESHRAAAGLTNTRVYRMADDPNEVVVLMDTRDTKSAKEFALLAYFVAHPAETLSRDRLLDAVWGYDNYPNTRTVDTHILHLRQKLEVNPEEPRLFLTVHGSGYKFVG